MTKSITAHERPVTTTRQPRSRMLSNDDSSTQDDTYTVHTRLLFDPLTQTFKSNISITISRTSGLITALNSRPSLSPTSTPNSPSDLDLTHLPLVLPGLTDLHTHIFLHLYSSSPSSIQESQESPVERILRATNHLRSALKAGFTTYRDLGTEGLFTADIDVRNAVNRGLIPGPRLFVVGEAIASSGGYAVRSENDLSSSLGTPYTSNGSGYAFASTTIGRLSDQADGPIGVTAAVRRRLATGADLIKVYADYRSRALRWPAQNLVSRPHDPHAEIVHPPAPTVRNPNTCLWTQDELTTLVSTAHAMGAPVAAHAASAAAVIMAVTAGVTTIEHGYEDEYESALTNPFAKSLEPDAALKLMAERGTIWVPTLYILEAEADHEQFERACQRVRRGWELGVRIGVGGDTGPVLHGGQGREVELLVRRCGIPLVDVLRAVTLGGWEGVCGRRVVNGENGSLRIGGVIGSGKSDQEGWDGKGYRWFGAVREGWVADLVGLGSDIRKDVSAIRDVRIVIKDGRVVVREGQVVE